jgi:hypothetical protein
MNPQDMAGLAPFKSMLDLFPGSGPKNQKEGKP